MDDEAKAAAKATSLLKSIANVIVVNGPMNLVSLEAHCHDKGLDSRILNWICNDDLAAYSPTCILHACMHKVGLVVGTDADCKTSSDPKPNYMHLFPCVSILECANDSSIPSSQGQGFYDALTSASAGASGSAAVHVLRRIYANKQHTSLVVEDPLVGNYAFCYDVDSIIAANFKKGKGTKKGKGNGKGSGTLHNVHVDEVITKATVPSLRSLHTGVQPKEEQLPSYVNFVAVAIARSVSPF